METLKKDLIFNFLSEKISSGEYPPGYRFPTELEFSRQLGVGKVTLRSALAKLEKLGMVERKVSQGTFVPGHFMPMGKRFAVVYSPMPEISNPYLYIMPGIERRSLRKNVELVRATYDYAKTPGFFKEAQCSGIIILGSDFIGNEPILTAVRQSQLPAVILGRDTDCAATQMAVIATDTHQAWLQALNHLKRCHCKRIATIWLHADTVRTGFKGDYRSYLTENGFENSADLIFSAKYEDRSIRETVDKILSLPQRPDAIIGYSDFFALIIMQQLKECGISIPGDIAVIGCCGYPGSAFLETPLSTVDFQYEKKGERAIDLLLEANRWFHANTETPLEYISSKLIERSSTDRKK